MSATIQLAETTYQPLAEGKYVFTVEEISYNVNFNRVECRFTTESGKKLYYTFFLQKADGSKNDVQLQQFSKMAKSCLNDSNAKSIDPDLLKGKSFQAEVVHSVLPKKDNPSETVTFVNLRNFEPAVAPSISDDDLDALLG